MANKKISELDIRTSLSLSDLLAVGDPTTGYLYKITITDLKTLTGAGVISFNGRVGSVTPAEGDYNLTQLGDVIITSASNNQILQYNGSNWVNATINLSAYVPYTGASANVDLGTFDLTTDIVTLNQVKAVGSGGISFNSNNGTQIAAMGGGGGANITFYGGMTGTTISLSSSATASSFIKTSGTSSQFLKADGSVDSSTYLTTSSASSTYVPLSRTLTINGTSYDLSADRSWTINSMVYPGAGIAVSTGTAWGTSITDNSANWDAAYTARITSATSPLNITSNVISITQASTSANGYLSSTDWNTFNNKIGGSGASGYVSFFNGAASITGSTNLFWDAANSRLGVGTNTPSAGITSFSSTAATQFKAAGTAPAFTFSETLASPIYGAVFGLATSAGQFVTGTIAGDMAIANQSQSAGAIVFGTGTTEYMRLTPAGTFSIGNTNSTYKLDVTGIGRFTTSLFVSSAGADTVSSGANIQFSSNAVIQTNTALGLDFWMNNSGTWNRKVTITNAGLVGIGTTSPTDSSGFGQILDLNGSTASAYYTRYNGSSTIYALFGQDSGTTYILTKSTPLAFYVNNAERMRITSAGNVGIGTTSPSQKFNVVNSSDGFSAGISGTTYGLRFDNGGSFAFGGSTIHGVDNTLSGSYQILGLNGSQIIFGTSYTERMRISSAGPLLINTTTNTATGWKLQSNGIIATLGTDAALVYADRATPSTQYYLFGNSGSTNFFNSGTISQINMTTGVYTPLSDINKKKDFEDSAIGLNAILNLKPTLYRMKSDNNTIEKQLGFIAQEVKEFIPQAYVESGEAKDKFIGLQDRPIIAALVKSIQEQQSQIEQLKAQLK
jgi:hypothetical protein